MSKQTEALKLALEALEGLEALLLSMGLTHLIVYGDAEKAITSLSQAIANEALDRMAENARELGLDYEPAQQEQEPGVAVFELQESGWEIICDGDWIQTLPLRTKLYTSPQPAQPSNPLTDEEIESINVKFAGSRDLARLFARAIEAAHGIKGDA